MADSVPGFVLVEGMMAQFALPHVWFRVTPDSKASKLMAAYLQQIEAQQIMLPSLSSVHFRFGEQTLHRDSGATIDSLGVQGISHWSSGPITTCTIKAVVVQVYGPPRGKPLLRTRQCRQIGK